MRTEAMKKQVGGDHYNKHMNLQTWDIVDEYGLTYYEGNALKYILREKDNRVEDLEKAIHYLEKQIEVLKQEDDSPKLFEYDDKMDSFKYFNSGEYAVDKDYEALLKDDEHQENIDKLKEESYEHIVDPIRVVVQKNGTIHIDPNGHPLDQVMDTLFNQS
jgi:hypothetical protein